MPTAIIALALGAFLVVPLIATLTAALSTARLTTEDEFAYYSADAGIEAVVADLRQGKDPLAGGYATPTVALNNYTSTITVSVPPRTDMLAFGEVFSDPETQTSLNPLAASTEFLHQIVNVRANSQLRINWVFTPTTSSWILSAYEGVGTGGTQVGTDSGSGSPARLLVDPDQIKGGTYTLSFFNNSASAVTSAAYSAEGDSDNTWVAATAYQDYLITSTAGNITISVFARQSPGPNTVESQVHTTTWHGPN